MRGAGPTQKYKQKVSRAGVSALLVLMLLLGGMEAELFSAGSPSDKPRSVQRIWCKPKKQVGLRMTPTTFLVIL